MKAAALVCLLAAPAFAAPLDEADAGRRLQAILRAHQSDVFGCVQSAKRPPSGEVLVRVFAGGAHGESVEQAEVLKDESGSPEVGRCVVGKIASWDLSSLEASPGDQIVFPLAFKPAAEPAGARLEQLTVAPGAPRTLPRGPERAIYALEGPVQVNDQRLTDGDVAWLPAGAPCVLVSTRNPAQVLEVDGIAGSGAGLAPKVVRAATVNWLTLPGGKGHVKLLLDETRASVAVDALTADAGAKIPPHRHETSEELIYIVAGKGVTTVAGQDTAMAPGVTLTIPAGAEHSLQVDEKLIAVQVYSPRGPEQRFKPGVAPNTPVKSGVKKGLK